MDRRLTGRNDRHVENARMNPKNQAWQPIDPAAGSLPPEIESALGDDDSLSACVVILVDSEIDRDWGAQATLAVAKRWASSGHSVLLADARLDGPVLHETVGVENGEGVSDMVLYGASAPRIAGRVEDRLMLAPAGTPVVQVAEVLNHVKWDGVIRGCREARVTLVFHVSTGTPGVEAMTKRAEGVLVLAPASKDVDAILGSESGPLIAVVGPENGDAPPVAVEDEPVTIEDAEVDAASVDALTGSPEEEEGALSIEAPPGLSEDEAPPAVTIEDLAELPTSAGEDGGTPDAFSVAGLEGAQYEEDDDSPPAQSDDVEMGAAMETDGEPVAASADTSLGTEGFEAGAGVDLEDALDDDGGASPVDPEPADAVASKGIDFGALELGVPGPTEVGTGAAPELGEAVSFADSLAELVVEEAPKEEEVEAPAIERQPRYRGLARLERRRKRAVFVRQFLTGLLTISIVGGGGIAVAYYGFVNIPGITPPNRVRSSVPPPLALPGQVPVSAIMSHVLLIEDYREIETPLTTAAELRIRLPNLLFFVTPLEVEGALQFALYAGPAYSAVEADALKGPVAVVMDRLDPNNWSVRAAPYAFYFGEYETPANAQRRIQALAETLVLPCPGGELIGSLCVDLSAALPGGDPLFSRPTANSIPAYSLQVTYPDGTTGMRVYGGAFSDEFQAYDMGQMITRADVGETVLTSRRGILPE